MTVLGVKDDEETDLVGMRPLYLFPQRRWWIAAATLAGLFATLLAVWYWRRMRRGGAMPQADPELPPGAWALREIQRRRVLPVCATGPAKAVYTEASDLLRHYLLRRYGIDAPDMTTYECMRALAIHDLEGTAAPGIRRFLDECDMVKFSKFEPDQERWDRLWDELRGIVEQTTPADESAPSTRRVAPGPVAAGVAP
jgi:hypothetical protein